jgi:hypothetical protein
MSEPRFPPGIALAIMCAALVGWAIVLAVLFF